MTNCFYCCKEATTEKGTIFVRVQIVGAKWENVSCCVNCFDKEGYSKK